MQAPAAYVEQIPPGARPPVRAAAHAPPPAPAGLYLQVASAPDQPSAVRASLDVVTRLGAARPPYVRGVVAQVGGRPRIRLYAGPLAGESGGRALCSRLFPTGSPCLLTNLPADAPGRPAPAPRPPAHG